MRVPMATSVVVWCSRLPTPFLYRLRLECASILFVKGSSFGGDDLREAFRIGSFLFPGQVQSAQPFLEDRCFAAQNARNMTHGDARRCREIAARSRARAMAFGRHAASNSPGRHGAVGSAAAFICWRTQPAACLSQAVSGVLDEAACLL